jgi:hypothetical protein
MVGKGGCMYMIAQHRSTLYYIRFEGHTLDSCHDALTMLFYIVLCTM